MIGVEPVRPELFPPHSTALQQFELTPGQLDLVWDMNRDLSRREFDNFIETCRALGLNPFKRQICPIVLPSGGKARNRRQVAVFTTTAGLRAIADRSGTYRPDPKPPRICFDEAKKNARTNPLGIIECVVTPYRFAHGRWHRVSGQVWWDEIAPFCKESEGGTYLNPHTPWASRPRGQMAKCAEAAALRIGWPEGLANVYVEDEVDRVRTNQLSPSAEVEHVRKERANELARPKGMILVDLRDGNGLSAIPVDQFHDRVSEFIKARTPAGIQEVLDWRDQHRISFREFFGYDRKAAIELKRQFEALEILAKQVTDQYGV